MLNTIQTCFLPDLNSSISSGGTSFGMAEFGGFAGSSAGLGVKPGIYLCAIAAAQFLFLKEKFGLFECLNVTYRNDL